jgi:hypothetical protein
VLLTGPRLQKPYVVKSALLFVKYPRPGRVISAKVNLLNLRDQRLQQRVDLHLALGGSFDKKPAEALE